MIVEQNRAPLNTQLGNAPCTVGDTEDIFWLCLADDYQSRFQLGCALAAQYRFKEAMDAYQKALRIRTDDWTLYFYMAGSQVTLPRFDEAVASYYQCLALCAERKTVAYSLGIARSTAYRPAVSVFRGETSCEQALSTLTPETDDLRYVIILYGLLGYAAREKKADHENSLKTLLARNSVCPCSAYLSAWNDCHMQESGITKQAVKEFFDRLTPYWDNDLTVDTDKVNGILNVACVSAGSRVLDVACGTGVLFPFYAQRRVAQVTGVDLSPEMVKLARRKMHTPEFQVICGDIETMEVSGAYDCCVVYYAFPHFPEPARLIRTLAAWLKPNGRLTIAHSMSITVLNQHHAGSASSVSRGMISASAMKELLSGLFVVDTAVSDDEKYIVSGTVLPSGNGGTL